MDLSNGTKPVGKINSVEVIFYRHRHTTKIIEGSRIQVLDFKPDKIVRNFISLNGKGEIMNATLHNEVQGGIKILKSIFGKLREKLGDEYLPYAKSMKTIEIKDYDLRHENATIIFDGYAEINLTISYSNSWLL